MDERACSDSPKVAGMIKGGVLFLASELASEQGELVKAVEFVEQAIPYAAVHPVNMVFAQHSLGRKLQVAGRVDEAFAAFNKAIQLANDLQIPGDVQFDILVHLVEAAIHIGLWNEADEAMVKLSTLSRPPHIVENVIELLQRQLEGTKELRNRIEVLKSIKINNVFKTLLEANAVEVKPLLAWWREVEKSGCWMSKDKKKAGAQDDNDRGLRVIYDYWGGGGAARIMANFRKFAPDHFSPFIEVRTLTDIQRAIRMFSLISDTLILLWKGRTFGGQFTRTLVPITKDVVGGAGYIGFFGTIFRSPSGSQWVSALGKGACIPEEICRFLLSEAASLMEQGRLILFPAPAVGCLQPEFGPSEKLLVALMGLTPFLNRSNDLTSNSVGFVPFFENVPIPAIADILGERPE
ncbi:MAG: hypothetical protein HQM08_26765 [Candidatus Riflebacteria bacterium]|nr:hypothetical protein [Candidatus Riflebacteria bacterium]